MAKRKKVHQKKSGHSEVRHGRRDRIGGNLQGCCRTCRKTEKKAEWAPAQRGVKNRGGERLKIENFQFQVCVCVASTNLVSVKPLKCRVTKATQKWSKV